MRNVRPGRPGPPWTFAPRRTAVPAAAGNSRSFELLHLDRYSCRGHAVHVTWARFWDHGVARRIEAVNAFEFPSSVRQRFTLQHGEVGAEEVREVEAATRQWFRVAVRRPKGRLSVPSVAVNDLWRELVLHTQEYAAFCQSAFGRVLPHEPESALNSTGGTANRSTVLLATLDLARRDEGCGPQQLPLLFRVDQKVGIGGGRRYLADCGGRGQCFPVPGSVCLQHLGGVGKQLRSGGDATRGGSGAYGPHSFGDRGGDLGGGG